MAKLQKGISTQQLMFYKNFRADQLQTVTTPENGSANAVEK